jgi:VWFA-related protein
MVRASLAGALIAAVVSSGRAPQQAQAPVFRITADLIEVHAVVKDRSGAIVRGLTREDFSVFEDGKPQSVVQFFFVDKPLPAPSAADRRPVATPADVASNAQPPDRRLYLLVLDAANVDASRSTVVKRLARQFIDENLGPNDLAAVMQLGRAGVNQPFTSDRALLAKALDQFIGHKPPSATATITQDALLRPQTGRQPQDSEAGSRSNEARRMLESLKQVCESLGATRGFRRSLILFSEGVDVDTSDLIGQDQRPGARGGMDPLTHDPAKTAGFVLQAQADLYAAARRASVSIYPVDPRGNTMGEDLQMQQVSTVAGAVPSPVLSIMGEVQRGQGVLRTMAETTGGQAIVGTGNFKAGFGSIVEANSAYYVLAYQPANTARDGSFRQISVSVGRPGLVVSARKGYAAPVDAPPAAAPPTAPPNAPSPRMRELLANELPGGSLPLRLAGGPVRPQGDKMLIGFVLDIDTASWTFKEDGGFFLNDIELAYLAIDPSARMVSADRRAAPLRLTPAQRSALAGGLKFAAEFLAGPGRYQVRAALHESAGDSSGNVLLDVDVPNVSNAPLSMGAVFLASTAPGLPPDGSWALLRSVLPVPPSAVRRFSAGETLAVFVNVFAARASESSSVEVLTVVRSADGRETFRTAVTKSGAEVAAAQGGYGHVVKVPLGGSAPGEYAITLTAKSSTGQSASRTVTYRVG